MVSGGVSTWTSTSSLNISASNGLPSGSAGQTLTYQGSSWQGTSSLTVQASGYVRIGTGTTTPYQALHMTMNSADSAIQYQTITGSLTTSGPNNPSAASNNSSVGTVAWNNPTNVYSHNFSNAESSLANGETSYYLIASGTGFSVPAGNYIAGIKVEVEKSDMGATTYDYSIRLVKGGVVVGDNKASGSDWPSSSTYVPYGSDSDTWGIYWTPSDINSSNFGVAVSAQCSYVVGCFADIDHIRITVYYAPAGNASWVAGIDYSDSAKFKIGYGSALGGGAD
jgi:hypothetical protein